MKPSQQIRLIALALFLAVPMCAFSQQEENSPETRLREALRNTTIQLRTAQSDNAGLQVTQGELEKERDALKKQVADLAKQGEKDRTAAAKEIADLKASVTAMEEKSTKLSTDLAKWKDSAQQAAQTAQAKEQARATLEIRAAELERAVADRETRNVALVKIANEILNRLEKFGLGDAIKAREPFIGAKRIEIQKLVQDYTDKILDQKYQPGGTTPTQAPQPAKTPQPSPSAKPVQSPQPTKAAQPSHSSDTTFTASAR
ncbi:MAG: hypothetical protein PHQ12_10515 [Chthoniobacteraceae bacterium]|nr:hypothetical protein [Chthoniobacteraceae bacterium]